MKEGLDEGSEREAEEKNTIKPYPFTSVDSFLFHSIPFHSVPLHCVDRQRVLTLWHPPRRGTR